MSRALTILVCLLILAGVAGGIWLMGELKTPPSPTPPEERIPVVRVLVVEAKDRRIDVETQGTVVPRTEIRLMAQVGGRVESISPSLASGGFFAKDEVLVQIDPRDYELAVTRAAAAVAQAEVAVRREAAEGELARSEWKALGIGEGTPLTLREPQFLEAKAALAAAEATLQTARLDLERTTCRAPFAGRVRRKSVDSGQFVGAGTELAQIYAVDYAEVRLPLHDSALKYLDLPLRYRNGDTSTSRPRVTLRTRFAQEVEEWFGHIVRTEGEIDPRSRMVHAIAQVEDPYARGADNARPPLAVGMFVTATIEGRSFPEVIEIPGVALRDGGEVLVVDGENRLRSRAVEILRATDDTVILASGIESGARVCISPLGIAFDGMKVEPELVGPTGDDGTPR